MSTHKAIVRGDHIVHGRLAAGFGDVAWNYFDAQVMAQPFNVWCHDSGPYYASGLFIVEAEILDVPTPTPDPSPEEEALCARHQR